MIVAAVPLEPPLEPSSRAPPWRPDSASHDLTQSSLRPSQGISCLSDSRTDALVERQWGCRAWFALLPALGSAILPTSPHAGRVRLSVAADRSADLLCGFVESAVLPGSPIVTDDWSGYGGFRTRGYDHHAIAECGDPEVAEEFMPIIHLVFSNLKNWLNGIHHGVSAKHLQTYLNEFTFRFNRWFNAFNALRSLLGIAGGAEAPTYAERYSGEWKHPACSGSLH